jgi:hypothetical protein
MISLPGIELTQEQLQIIDTLGPPPPQLLPPLIDAATSKDHRNQKNDTNNNYSKPKLIRITAAAGTGKTTTLLSIALRAVELGYTEITYLTFTASAARDGEERMRRALQQQREQKEAPITSSSSSVQINACTLHACAHRLLSSSSSLSQTKDRKRTSPPKLWSDNAIRRWISMECKNDAEAFLRPCYDEIASRVYETKRDPASAHKQERYMQKQALEQVQFFIYKSLVHFCQSCWTLEEYKAGTPFNRDYYPIQKFHGHYGKGEKYYGFPMAVYNHRSKMAFYADQAPRLWEIIVEKEMRSFDFDMKRVQLLSCRIPGQILLVDESQDMDACQIHWITHGQTQPTVSLHHPSLSYVYVVGDPAQSIYGFRGARPRYLMELSQNDTLHADLFLTETWRFGSSIANIANLILFAKEHSEQTTRTRDGQYRDWIPYRIRTVNAPNNANPTNHNNNNCRVTHLPLVDMHWRDNQSKNNYNNRTCPSQKVTFIARENVTVMLFTLEALGFTVSDEREDNAASNNNVLDEEVVSNMEVGSVDEFSNVQHDSPDDEDEEEHFARLADYEDSSAIPEFVSSFGSDQYPENLLKVHINGRGNGSGIQLWQKSFKLVECVYALYRLSKTCPQATKVLNARLFPEFASRQVSWTSFLTECSEKELTKYNNIINVVQKFQSQTMNAVQMFRTHVLDRRFSAEEADLIVTTCHSAKGMEWDNVQIANDFVEMRVFREKPGTVHASPTSTLQFAPNNRSRRLNSEWEFAFKNYGDKSIFFMSQAPAQDEQYRFHPGFLTFSKH